MGDVSINDTDVISEGLKQALKEIKGEEVEQIRVPAKALTAKELKKQEKMLQPHRHQMIADRRRAINLKEKEAKAIQRYDAYQRAHPPKCFFCGNTYSDGKAKFCSNCGKSNCCTSCGIAFPDSTAKFCSNCGNSK